MWKEAPEGPSRSNVPSHHLGARRAAKPWAWARPATAWRRHGCMETEAPGSRQLRLRALGARHTVCKHAAQQQVWLTPNASLRWRSGTPSQQRLGKPTPGEPRLRGRQHCYTHHAPATNRGLVCGMAGDRRRGRSRRLNRRRSRRRLCAARLHARVMSPLPPAPQARRRRALRAAKGAGPSPGSLPSPPPPRPIASRAPGLAASPAAARRRPRRARPLAPCARGVQGGERSATGVRAARQGCASARCIGTPLAAVCCLRRRKSCAPHGAPMRTWRAAPLRRYAPSAAAAPAPAGRPGAEQEQSRAAAPGDLRQRLGAAWRTRRARLGTQPSHCYCDRELHITCLTSMRTRWLTAERVPASDTTPASVQNRELLRSKMRSGPPPADMGAGQRQCTHQCAAAGGKMVRSLGGAVWSAHGPISASQETDIVIYHCEPGSGTAYRAVWEISDSGCRRVFFRDPWCHARRCERATQQWIVASFYSAARLVKLHASVDSGCQTSQPSRARSGGAPPPPRRTVRRLPRETAATPGADVPCADALRSDQRLRQPSARPAASPAAAAGAVAAARMASRMV